MTIESFKSKIQCLFDNLTELLSLYNQLKVYVSSFEKFSDEILQRIQLLIRKSLPISILLPHIENYVKIYWLHYYIAVKDELAVLIKGELQRKYHRREHKKYIHDRGHEQTYFLDKYKLSSCSCDGLDYEYRILSDLRPDHPKLETLATSLDDINGKFQIENDRIDACFWKLKLLLSEITSISSIDISCLHNNEFIKVYFVDGLSPLKIFRSDIPTDESRAQALSPIIEDLEGYDDLTSIPLKKVANHINRNTNVVVIDSDDEMTIDTHTENKANIDNIMGNYEEKSLREIKLAHGVDEDERDKYDSDGNIIEENILAEESVISRENTSESMPITTNKRKQKSHMSNNRPENDVKVGLRGFLMPKPVESTIVLKIIDPKATEVTFFDLSINYCFLSLNVNSKKVLHGNDLLTSCLIELWTGAVHRPWIPLDIVLSDRSYDRSKSFFALSIFFT